jgi:hypothetical protein
MQLRFHMAISSASPRLSCITSFGVDSHVMPDEGPADGSRREAAQPPRSAWQRYRGIYDFPGRLSRSATIALILSPIGLLFISVTRLLIVSDYNPVTASAIVSSGGYVDTLLGTIIPIVPILLPYLALILLFFSRVAAAILTFLAMVVVSPIATSRSSALKRAEKDWHLAIHHNLLLAFIMIILASALALLLSGELVSSGFNAVLKTVATIASLVLIPFVVHLYPLPFKSEFYVQLIKQPWLPAETITLSSGQDFTGYVLADSGAWLVVLNNDNRLVHYYLAKDVVSREDCQIVPTPPTQPLITLSPAGLHAPTHTPSCEASSTAPSSSAIRRKDHPSMAHAVPFVHATVLSPLPVGEGA